MSTKKPVAYNAFSVRESTNGGKPNWLQVGVAFENTDASLTVLLNALPLGGKLVLQKPSPKKS